MATCRSTSSRSSRLPATSCRTSTVDQTIASAFHANAMFDPGVRWESVLDQVNTTGTVFLGLTVGCAVSQPQVRPADSARIFPTLRVLRQREHQPVRAGLGGRKGGARRGPGARRRNQDRDGTLTKTELKASVEAWVASLTADGPGSLARRRASCAVDGDPGGRSPDQLARLMAVRAARDSRYQELTREIDRREKRGPQLAGHAGLRAEPRETRLFVRGNPERPGEVVRGGSARVFASAPRSRDSRRGSIWPVGSWPPTIRCVGRVTVNRIWQHDFGQGIVETADNFGDADAAAGPPRFARLAGHRICSQVVERQSGPSLDRLFGHLSAKLAAGGPSWKRSTRPIACLARQRRLRVEAEIHSRPGPRCGRIVVGQARRPECLSASAARECWTDGPSPATWTTSPGADRYRRGMYTWVWRLTPYPTLRLFDAPDAATACTRRERSNTPVQALTLLNDPTFVECARGLAGRVIRARRYGRRAPGLVPFAFASAARPAQREADCSCRLLAEQSAELPADTDAARKIAGTDLTRSAATWLRRRPGRSSVGPC